MKLQILCFLSQVEKELSQKGGCFTLWKGFSSQQLYFYALRKGKEIWFLIFFLKKFSTGSLLEGSMTRNYFNIFWEIYCIQL